MFACIYEWMYVFKSIFFSVYVHTNSQFFLFYVCSVIRWPQRNLSWAIAMWEHLILVNQFEWTVIWYVFIGSQYYHCFFFFPPMQNLFHSANPSHSLTIYIYIYSLTHAHSLTSSSTISFSFFLFFLSSSLFLSKYAGPSITVSNDHDNSS